MNYMTLTLLNIEVLCYVNSLFFFFFFFVYIFLSHTSAAHAQIIHLHLENSVYAGRNINAIQ